MTYSGSGRGVTVEGGFDPAGRAVDIGRGLQWLGEGWQLFVKAAGVWVAIAALLLVATVAIGLVPIIGSIALTFLYPVAFAGMLSGCREISRGGQLRVDQLFAALRGRDSGALVTVGVYSVLANGAVMLLMFLIGGSFALSGASLARGAAGAGLLLGSGILLAALVGLALLVPVSMALWFAPPLIVFGGLAPLPALKASFFGCLKNILPFLVYGVVLFVLIVLAAMPAGLGFLVLFPVIAGSIHAAYQDIYE